MKLRKLAGAALLGLAFASPSAFANLIVNGSFEAPVFPLNGAGYAGPPYAMGNDLTPWVIGGHVVVFGSAYDPSGPGVIYGNQAIQIELVGDYIEQTFATSNGAAYNISFALDRYVPSSGTVGITVNGVGTTPSSQVATDSWVTYLASFVADNSGSTTLRFTSLAFYPQLDNVIVDLATPAAPGPVPEPATLALLGLGLAGVFFSRRKRQS